MRNTRIAFVAALALLALLFWSSRGFAPASRESVPQVPEPSSPAAPAAPRDAPQLTARARQLLERDPAAALRAIDEADPDEDYGPCAQTIRAVGDSFKTPWGITPRDVQNTALGTRRVPLKWRYEAAMSYGVEGTSTTLLVEITRGKGPVKFVRRDGSQRDGQMMAYDCSSSELRIPVHVKATTRDGVVSVEGDSELLVSSRSSIVVTLYAAQQGTLRIRETREKGTAVDSFGIVLGFRGKRTMVGAIGGGYKCADDNCLHIPYAYACFPEDPPFLPNEFIFGACRERP